MHMFSREKHFYGGHGIVAAQVPLGAGHAFADKYLGNDNVTFAYFGDGARTRSGLRRDLQHGRALGAAGHFRHREQPVCHGTWMKRSTRRRRCSAGAEGLRHSRRAGDGMDVLAVKAAGRKAVAHCRASKAPTSWR